MFDTVTLMGENRMKAEERHNLTITGITRQDFSSFRISHIMMSKNLDPSHTNINKRIRRSSCLANPTRNCLLNGHAHSPQHLHRSVDSDSPSTNP